MFDRKYKYLNLKHQTYIFFRILVIFYVAKTFGNNIQFQSYKFNVVDILYCFAMTE